MATHADLNADLNGGMRFCAAHWDRLRQAIDARGLTPFVQVAKQIREHRAGKDTFDPLMGAHWSIATNVMQRIDRAGVDPLYLLSGGPEDPVDAARYPAKAGLTWPRCPLCYLNLAHEVSCTDLRCRLDKVAGYDWMIDRAADDALAQARAYGLVP